MLLVAVLSGWPLPALAQRIDRYAETLAIDADGSARGTIAVDVTGVAASGFRLPVTWTGASEASVRRPAGAAVVITRDAGRDWFVVTPGPDVGGSMTIELAYRVASAVDFSAAPPAYGHRRLRCEFVNTTGLVIGQFESAVVLPPGYVVTNVNEVVPVSTESSVGLPYDLTRTDGLGTVTIHASPLDVGDEAAMTLRFKAQTSPVPLLAGLALVGVFYLFRFRDLLTQRSTSATGPSGRARQGSSP